MKKKKRKKVTYEKLRFERRKNVRKLGAHTHRKKKKKKKGYKECPREWAWNLYELKRLY